MARKREETPLDEAMRLSNRRGAAMSSSDDLEFDPDVADLNNPDVETLSEPPLLGSRPKNTEMFGEDAETFGRASSPKLYAAAAQFPTATQFRVWRWENGIPVGLGAIDAEATEDDFVRQFFDAMPQAGEGRLQFRMRPIDIRGAELGKEFTINISEHHSTLKKIRDRKRAEKEGEPMWNGRGGQGGDIIVNTPSGNETAGSTYAEEMGRMFEQAVEAAESRTKALQETLEEERERLRHEDARRVEERVGLAERSASVVQQMTEKLMNTDRLRSEEAMKSQKEHSGFMLNTLTNVFSQQQEAARMQSDRMREMDTLRMQQDREFFERQRQEMEMLRQRERDEAERKRAQETAELERRRQMEKDEYERKRREETEEYTRRRAEEQEKLRMEQMRWEESRRMEIETIRDEARRRESEAERRRQAEKEELEAKLRREQLDIEQKREAAREERERFQTQLEDRRRLEAQEFERKMAAEREERERRERSDRERWERETREAERHREDERREWERRETLRREEMTREADRRREEMQLQMKQMEMNAQRDREHAERMMEMARLEREAQREAQVNREKSEREAREAQDRDRQRQHEMGMKEMEMSKERDREHQERMLQLTKMQQAGGLGAITEMLGMDTGEILSKVFGGGGGGEGGSWTDAIPKVLGAVADMGKVAMQAQAAQAQAMQQQQQAARPRREPQMVAPQGGEQQIAIQTPQGIRLIPASALAGLQQNMGQQRRPVPVEQTIIDAEARPPSASAALEAEFARMDAEESAAAAQQAAPEPAEQPAPKEEAPAIDPDYIAGSQVNYMKRARQHGVKLPQQRNARKAIRELGAKLGVSPEEDWTGIVTEAITTTPDIYFYIEAVSIWAALAEAKIEPVLAGRIVKALKDSGAIPDSVPYSEEDYNRGHANKEEA